MGIGIVLKSFKMGINKSSCSYYVALLALYSGERLLEALVGFRIDMARMQVLACCSVVILLLMHKDFFWYTVKILLLQ